MKELCFCASIYRHRRGVLIEKQKMTNSAAPFLAFGTLYYKVPLLHDFKKLVPWVGFLHPEFVQFDLRISEGLEKISTFEFFQVPELIW